MSAGGSGAGGSAQDSGGAHGLLDEAKTQAGALADDARSSLESAAADGKDQIADRLEDAAKAIHKSGEQLEGQQDWLAGLVERGADELSGFAATLRGNDIQGLMGSLEDLARRQPAVFVGAAIAAGFAMTRLGKLAASGLTNDDLPELPEVHLGNPA
ncbi:MAG TPA: hypothetical protein VH722_15830 [Alphaproteobacteria bacterium]|nr:hypothetical protein [Alphaproteobacteria bacterium]